MILALLQGQYFHFMRRRRPIRVALGPWRQVPTSRTVRHGPTRLATLAWVAALDRPGSCVSTAPFVIPDRASCSSTRAFACQIRTIIRQSQHVLPFGHNSSSCAAITAVDCCNSQPTFPIGIKMPAYQPTSLGLFVKHRRKANRMTQRELGELAGVGTRLVSELERGKPTLRLDAINRVLGVFGRTAGPIELPRPRGSAQ